jgi:hypothetical protein
MIGSMAEDCGGATGYGGCFQAINEIAQRVIVSIVDAP